MKIIFIITGLTSGGAEMMLYKLLTNIDRQRFSPTVVSLMDRGTLADKLEAVDIPVYTLGMKQGGLPTPQMIWKLVNIMTKTNPDLVQGWMYHSNLAAQLSNILSFKFVPIIWNIRHSLNSLSDESSGTAAVIRTSIPLSNFTEKIIYNSQISAVQHQKLGYPADKEVTIPNGFDPELFKPSIDARHAVRAELGLASDCLLIGRFARFHEMKDYPNLLRGAAILLKDRPDTHFLLVGRNLNLDNQVLSKLIGELGIGDRIHLKEESYNIPYYTAALDIATTTSSHGEAFPNVVGEAMCCGVPCVVTDVGDSAWIVGETGKVVPPRQPEALADAWREVIDLGAEGRSVLGQAARARAVACFSLDSVVAQYEKLYESAVAKS
jgi:glycosyltransferase involved in cell wall biosynthesis